MIQLWQYVVLVSHAQWYPLLRVVRLLEYLNATISYSKGLRDQRMCRVLVKQNALKFTVSWLIHERFPSKL